MTEETPTPEPPRCSYCRKKMPTTVDRKKMAVSSDVCLCEHNWLQGKTAVLPEVRD